MRKAFLLENVCLRRHTDSSRCSQKNVAEEKLETETKKIQDRVEEELQDVKTLRITSRELSEACERRAMTIEELRGRLELAEQRLDEAEEDKKR